MNWKIKIESNAVKALQKLDKVTRQRIERFIDRLVGEENPRSRGIALQGEAYAGLWRYRVGDYRFWFASMGMTERQAPAWPMPFQPSWGLAFHRPPERKSP